MIPAVAVSIVWCVYDHPCTPIFLLSCQLYIVLIGKYTKNSDTQVDYQMLLCWMNHNYILKPEVEIADQMNLHQITTVAVYIGPLLLL